MRKLLPAVLVVLALAPASASAFTLQEVGGLNSPAIGIALGPDGNIWAAEEAAEAVVRVSPTGQILGHYPVGGEPLAIAAGPGGKVWATVPNTHELVWFDANQAAPTANHVSTGLAKCAPIGIANGGNGSMYFTMPSEESPCTSELGHVNADGTGEASVPSKAGSAFDLVALSGKLYTSSFEEDTVRRVGLPGLTIEAEIDMPAASGPSGIAADGAGNLWVTLYSSGQLAHFPATANTGALPTVLSPTGGSLVEAVGIAAAPDGKLYIPSGNAQLLAADATPSFAFSPLPASSEPWEIANGPNGDLWITDLSNTRLLHLYNPAPAVATSGSATTTPAVAKKAAPRLSLSGKSKQKLGGFVQLKVSCTTGPCTVSAGGVLTIKPGKGAVTHPKLKAATVQATAGKPKLLKLKIPTKAGKAAAAALAGGGKVSAKVTLKARDANGTSPVAAFKVKLTK